VLFATFLNSKENLCCTALSGDEQHVAAGFQDSSVKIYPLGVDRPPRGGFGGDRDDYRSAPPGGMGRGAPMDKGGAPGSYQPGFGRGN